MDGPTGFTPISGNPVVPGPYGNYTVTATDGDGATISGTYYYGPVHNINTYCDYGSIQTAINADSTVNTNTIVADDITFNENVTVNKQLTLIGNYGLTLKPIVNGSATAQVFLVTVPNVTIDNFEIWVSQATTLNGIKNRYFRYFQ